MKTFRLKDGELQDLLMQGNEITFEFIPPTSAEYKLIFDIQNFENAALFLDGVEKSIHYDYTYSQYHTDFETFTANRTYYINIKNSIPTALALVVYKRTPAESLCVRAESSPDNLTYKLHLSADSNYLTYPYTFEFNGKIEGLTMNDNIIRCSNVETNRRIKLRTYIYDEIYELEVVLGCNNN